MNGVPFAVVFGEDEIKDGNVKIKEMGLPEGHPEKEGVLVSLDDLVTEVKERISRKAKTDHLVQHAGGLRVVSGVHGEEVKKAEDAKKASEGVEEKKEAEKPIEPESQEEAESLEAVGVPPS